MRQEADFSAAEVCMLYAIERTVKAGPWSEDTGFCEITDAGPETLSFLRAGAVRRVE